MDGKLHWSFSGGDILKKIFQDINVIEKSPEIAAKLDEQFNEVKKK